MSGESSGVFHPLKDTRQGADRHEHRARADRPGN
jgi:hypothetical protein